VSLAFRLGAYQNQTWLKVLILKENKTDETRMVPLHQKGSLEEGLIETVFKNRCHYSPMEVSRLKIVIFGAFHAGKSTFIQAADPTSRHIDTECGDGTTTVALDYGKVVMDGLTVHLFRHTRTGTVRICPQDHHGRDGCCSSSG